MGGQTQRVLALLATAGPLTDHALADELKVPLASVNAVRNALLKRGLVRACDQVAGVAGARRTRWTLTGAQAGSRR
jgi:predicted ArsR family transcriptional regulator